MNGGTTILGLFEEIDPAATALTKLQDAENFDWRDLMVMSSVPFPEGVLEADKTKSRLPVITLIFAFVGIGVGLLLAGGSFALYVLRQGAKPVLSGPPIGIISYEFMMLSALTAAFLAALFEMRLPAWRARIYDPRISEGYIGIAARCTDLAGADRAERTLREAGAVDIKRDARSFE
jgi:hypothetical protein